ncbi:hypothetical protein [Advenella alkanexedens]|uniref:hypothetical protein n=1 Tax=Advenella alkanexedens TaxID=1481665 RepID=UPI0026743C92|nr:hypothetical protein [Advenella alkanexedens]WKU20897.1 hypothetical protein Q3V95_05870 [Advenella alkanexedens]
MKPGQNKQEVLLQETPFFITEEIEADMIAAGYVFEPPKHVSTVRLTDILALVLSRGLQDFSKCLKNVFKMTVCTEYCQYGYRT